MDVYRPSAVVLQCGADSLAGDKLGCFNITMNGHAHCVQFLRSFTVPLILLGGGGYTVKNVARTWTYETACALGIEKEIDPNLPWNEYFEWFGPRYRLEVPENNMDDLNIKDGSLDKVRFNALHQLAQLRCAPSVEMHDVPRDSLGKHLGLEVEVEREDGAMDDLDRRLARKQACLTFCRDSADTDTYRARALSVQVARSHSGIGRIRRGAMRLGRVVVPAESKANEHSDESVFQRGSEQECTAAAVLQECGQVGRDVWTGSVGEGVGVRSWHEWGANGRVGGAHGDGRTEQTHEGGECGRGLGGRGFRIACTCDGLYFCLYR